MIKSYTDLEQSKKLAEILPFESADMHYCLEQRDIASGYEIGITPYTKAKSFIGKCNIIDVKPAWSLAALLGVLPDYTLQDNPNGTVFVVSERKNQLCQMIMTILLMLAWLWLKS